MAAPNAQQIETLVLDEGNPESLILSNEDFKLVHDAYKQMSRDGEGIYIQVFNTKIRPPKKAAEPIVDLSKDEGSAFDS